MTNTISNLLAGVATTKDLTACNAILKRLTLSDGRTAYDIIHSLIDSKYDLGTLLSQDVGQMNAIYANLDPKHHHQVGDAYEEHSIMQYEVDSRCMYPEFYNKTTPTKVIGRDAIPCTNPAGIQKELEMVHYMANNPNDNHPFRFTTITAPPMKPGTYLLLTGQVSPKKILAL